MKRKLYNEFVGALRSGEWKQVTGYLRQMDGDKVIGHCGQGVLCELIDRKNREEGGGTKWRDHSYQFPDGSWRSTIPSGLLSCMDADVLAYIPSWNDGGMNFNQIADRMDGLVANGVLKLEDDE